MGTIFGHNGHHQENLQKLKKAGTYSAKSSIYMGFHLHLLYLLTDLKLITSLKHVICVMMCRASTMDGVNILQKLFYFYLA
jgi:hypothetical protein